MATLQALPCYRIPGVNPSSCCPVLLPRPLKRLFTANQCRTSFLDAGGLRDIEVEAITKMLACCTRILGVKEYTCDKPDCPHIRYVTNSCGSCASPSRGKKATALWTATQLNRLPDCDWLHLVFTLPDSCGRCSKVTGGC